MYGRPIHIYCYSQEPINIFQHIQNRPGVESELNIPIRFLCFYEDPGFSIVAPIMLNDNGDIHVSDIYL